VIRQGRDVASSGRRATRGAAIFADRSVAQPGRYGMPHAQTCRKQLNRQFGCDRDVNARAVSLPIAGCGDDAVTLGCRPSGPLRYALPPGPRAVRLVASAGPKDDRIARAGFSADRGCGMGGAASHRRNGSARLARVVERERACARPP
jgi:hypothetical protein